MIGAALAFVMKRPRVVAGLALAIVGALASALVWSLVQLGTAETRADRLETERDQKAAAAVRWEAAAQARTEAITRLQSNAAAERERFATILAAERAQRSAAETEAERERDAARNAAAALQGARNENPELDRCLGLPVPDGLAERLWNDTGAAPAGSGRDGADRDRAPARGADRAMPRG